MKILNFYNFYMAYEVLDFFRGLQGITSRLRSIGSYFEGIMGYMIGFFYKCMENNKLLASGSQKSDAKPYQLPKSISRLRGMVSYFEGIVGYMIGFF